MPQPLWQEEPPARRPVILRPGAYREFSVLGERFLYQPDEMRLFRLEQDAAAPVAAQRVAVPQFALPAVSPRMVVLLPTLACNLRCRYCFEAARPAAKAEEPANPENPANQTETGIDADNVASGGAVMSRAVWRRGLELIAAGGEATVCFFGGEPLLAFAVVRDAVAYARQRFRSPRFCLTTNGTLLTAPAVDFLAREQFSLIVSLDGPPHLHDAARPDARGNGSYAAVLAGLAQIARHPALAARVTLRGTYDGAGRYAHLLERVRHLNLLCRRFGLGAVAVEPADLSEGCARGGRPVAPSEALLHEYLDTAEWIARERAAGRRAHLHHFDARLRRLRRREPAPSECGAGVGYLTVAPDGAIHACHRQGCAVGDVRAGGVDLLRQQPWRDNRYYARSGCADCWLRNVCGGGCRINSLHGCGDLRQPDPFGCWLTEVCVKCAAWLLARAPAAEEDTVTNDVTLHGQQEKG